MDRAQIAEEQLMAQVLRAIERQADLLPEQYSKDEVARLIIASIMHARCSVLETNLISNERERTRFIRTQRAVANELLDMERMPL